MSGRESRNGRSTGGFFRKPAPPRKPPQKRKMLVLSETASKKSKTDSGTGQNSFLNLFFYILITPVDPYQFITLEMSHTRWLIVCILLPQI